MFVTKSMNGHVSGAEIWCFIMVKVAFHLENQYPKKMTPLDPNDLNIITYTCVGSVLQLYCKELVNKD